MGLIYCLYSTQDGQPRYVGQTTGSGPKRLKQHLAAALNKDELSPVCEWVRGVLRKGYSIRIWAIQDDIAPKDLDMFEGYWIDQFKNLLNQESTPGTPSSTALKIIEATCADAAAVAREREASR